MPEMTGTDLAALVASQYPSTPVLLMSGQGRPSADYPGPFLPKPFTPDALLEAVGGLVPLPNTKYAQQEPSRKQPRSTGLTSIWPSEACLRPRRLLRLLKPPGSTCRTAQG